MGRTQRIRKQRITSSTPKEKEDVDRYALGALFKYLHSFGWCNETSLTARQFPNTGRGLCSKTHRIATGDIIIRLPAKCLLTIETLEKDDTFKAYFSDKLFNKDRRISFHALLALYILHQKHLGENSSMYAYICSLPKQFSVPYFCTIRELQYLPDVVLERTVAQNLLIKDNFASICQIIDSPFCSCCGQSIIEDIFTLNAFKWAYFVVNTRSVFVNSKQLRSPQCEGYYFKPLLKDGTNLALAPFLDLFNHSDKVSTIAELSPNSTGGPQNLDYVLTLQHAPSKSIPCYKQVFISYGPLTNLKLFSEYGFVLYKNLHDYFEFSLHDIEQFLKQVAPFKELTFHRNKFKFIREHNLHDQMFIHSSDGISHNLRVVLHLLIKEPSHFPNILSQVAFGAATLLDDMSEELPLLIRYKMEEYKRFMVSLEALHPLTDSAMIAVTYINESIRYLESFLELNYVKA